MIWYRKSSIKTLIGNVRLNHYVKGKLIKRQSSELLENIIWRLYLGNPSYDDTNPYHNDNWQQVQQFEEKNTRTEKKFL